MTDLYVLPEADTNCFDEDTGKDCWSFSREILLQEITKAELRGREAMRQECMKDYVPRVGQPKPKIVCYIDSADIEYMKLPGGRIVRVSNVSWDAYQVPLYRWR